MRKLAHLIDNAKTSKFSLWKLNKLFVFAIPFMKPHRFKILKLSAEEVVTMAPYRRSNFNHLKGVHACAIATIAEWASGTLLIQNFKPDQYRLIMAKLDVGYYYQGKMDLMASATVDAESIANLTEAMKTQDAVNTEVIAEIYDAAENHVATCKTTWQIKPWSKVKTRV